MKKIQIFRGVLSLLVFCAAALYGAGTVMAQYSCKDNGFYQYHANNESYSTGCGTAFASCVDSYNSAQQEYIKCTGRGGCWDIGRPAWIESPASCPAEGADLESYFKGHDPDAWKGGVDYCNCIDGCKSKNPDPSVRTKCDTDFSECCTKLMDMKPDAEKETVVPQEKKPEEKYDLKISPESFTIVADGISEQQITAEVTGTNLSGKKVELRAEISRPNSIAPGKMANTKLAGNKISVFYVAPQINESLLKDSKDEVADLIYIYAVIDGKEIYKVSKAVLTLQGGEYTLVFEKNGFSTTKKTHSFDKGSLSGDIYITDSKGEKHLIKGVKVTLKSPRSDEKDVVRESVDGQYFFEKMGGTGEEDFDVEMAVSDDLKGDLDNMKQYNENVKKFGEFDAIRVIDEFYGPLAEAKGGDIDKVLTGIKVAGYSLFYLDYYDRKAIESLDNFIEFTQNIFKDALSLFLSYVNLTDGIWKYKEGNTGWKNPVGLAISKMTQFNSREAFIKDAAKKFFKGIIDTLTGLISKYPRAAEINKIWIGAYEGDLYNRGVGAYDESDLAKTINKKIEDGLHAFYIEDISKMMKTFRLDIKNPPAGFSANLPKSRAVFEANAKKHEERNDKQYNWTMGAAWTSLLHDVGKGTIQAILVLETGPQMAEKINKILDKISLALNMLKMAASTNASYEWMMLYYEDELDLVRSLNLLYRGKDSTYLAGTNSRPETDLYAEDSNGGGIPGIPAALALTPLPDYPHALDSFIGAVKIKDEKMIESAAKSLKSIRESYESEQESLGGKLVDSLVPELAEDSKALLQKQGGLALADSLVQLKLLALSIDQSEATIASAESSVKELKDEYTGLNAGISQYLKKAETIKRQNKLNESAQQISLTGALKNSTTPPLPMLYVIIGAGVGLLLVFIILILTTRKVLLSIGLGLLAGALSFGGLYASQMMTSQGVPPSEETTQTIKENLNIPPLPKADVRQTKVVTTQQEEPTQEEVAVSKVNITTSGKDASALLVAKKHNLNFLIPDGFGLTTVVDEDNYLHLKGEKIAFTIDASEGGQFENLIKPGFTLGDYVDYKEYYTLGTRKSLKEVDAGSTRAILTEYTDPASLILYWKTADNYYLQFTIEGEKVTSDRSEVDKVVASLDLPASESKTGDCSFPNGDVEFWWKDSSQSQKDCFIQKNGFTPEIN